MSNFQAAAKEVAGQATQLTAAALSAGPSNRNQASQQQLTDECKVRIGDRFNGFSFRIKLQVYQY